MPPSLSRRITAALALACAIPSVASAHVPPPRYPRLRPTLEVCPWVGLGGGALVVDGAGVGLFDLKLGGDVTLPVDRGGDVRVGTFGEVATASFASVQAIGGLELFLGAAPRPLRMFYYSGEGAFTARLGAGWAWRGHAVPDARSSPVSSLTLTWGYRAPFSLRDYHDQSEAEPNQRDTLRYMTGARLWVGATVDLAGATAWQLSGGIEFEPVGSFRYLLGLY